MLQSTKGKNVLNVIKYKKCKVTNVIKYQNVEKISTSMKDEVLKNQKYSIF